MPDNHHPLTFSPLIVGVMRLGAWGAQLSTKEIEEFIDQCIDFGLVDFDHADIYGHYTEEDNFGRVLKRRPDLKQKLRITTKYGIKMVAENRPSHAIKSYDSSKAHMELSVNNSLRALGVDYLDLLLIHRPDYLMDPHEIAEGFTALKKAGKVKAFGVSNYSKSQFELLNSFIPLVTNQIEVSILQLDALNNGTLDQCMLAGIHPTAWSPFRRRGLVWNI